MGEKIVVGLIYLVILAGIIGIGVAADYYGAKYTCWKAQQVGGQCVIVQPHR